GHPAPVEPERVPIHAAARTIPLEAMVGVLGHWGAERLDNDPADLSQPFVVHVAREHPTARTVRPILRSVYGHQERHIGWLGFIAVCRTEQHLAVAAEPKIRRGVING